MARFPGWESLATFNTFVFRISLASFMAYAAGQLLDLQVFDRLRQWPQWWHCAAASGIARPSGRYADVFQRGVWQLRNPFMAANWMEIALVDYVIKLLVSSWRCLCRCTVPC